MRKLGILLPLASLPSDEGIGTTGKHAYKFIDYLASADVKFWQVLPLLPLSYGNSPYQPCSSEAFCHYYIDLELLKQDGLLSGGDYSLSDLISGERIDYGKQFFNKTAILRKAFSRFDKTKPDWQDFKRSGKCFDYAVFMTLKEKFSYKPWNEWGEYKTYDKRLIDGFIADNRDKIDFWLFTQYAFLKQWNTLREYANRKGVEIIGDMPIYLAYDSVEAWKYGKELFQFKGDGDPKFVAGVPPDAFSADGQLWGNPVYDWEKMKSHGYKWWKDRIKSAFLVYDVVRIDHFRGFDRYFRIKYGETTAKNGEWADACKSEMFKDFKSGIIAEDLGVYDDGVRKLMKDTGYPGMKVEAFCFDGNPYGEHKPSNYKENCVAYTGTHDNMPLAEMFSAADERQEKVILSDLKSECRKLGVKPVLKTTTERVYTAIRLLSASKAEIAIVPMHDIKAFKGEARINEPSKFSDDNWSFRFKTSDFDENTKRRIKSYAIKYGRGAE